MTRGDKRKNWHLLLAYELDEMLEGGQGFGKVAVLVVDERELVVEERVFGVEALSSLDKAKGQTEVVHPQILHSDAETGQMTAADHPG